MKSVQTLSKFQIKLSNLAIQKPRPSGIAGKKKKVQRRNSLLGVCVFSFLTNMGNIVKPSQTFSEQCNYVELSKTSKSSIFKGPNTLSFRGKHI